MRYFFGFLITVGLLLAVIFLLVRGTGNQGTPKTTRALSSYSTSNSEVSMTTAGPVNADSIHRQVRITVDRNSVTYEEIRGYNNQVTKRLHFANTEASYNVFLHALGHAGFTKGNPSKLLANELGYCPQNSRYVFELLNDGQQVQRYWTSDCGSPKTYLGNASVTIALFHAQVPDYDTVIENVQL